MPEPKADATTLGVRDVGQEFRERVTFGGRMRELWRSTGSRRLLHAGHGLSTNVGTSVLARAGARRKSILKESPQSGSPKR